MKISFDPHLVEEAVHLLARTAPDRWRTYRRAIDPLYEHPERDTRIAGAMLDLFSRWGAATLFDELLTPITGVDRALVARSQHAGDEGADLLVGAQRTVFVRVAAERILEPDELRRFLCHEVRHVTDMLDPRFGYAPDLGLGGRTRAESELVRNRYRVLWDLAIDQVEASPVPPAAREEELARAFAALDASQRGRLRARFLDPEARTHENLTAAARDPWAFLGEPRRGGATPGQPCPLCGFPTYDWATETSDEAIRADFPDWEPDHGACRQCSEIYGVGRSVASGGA